MSSKGTFKTSAPVGDGVYIMSQNVGATLSGISAGTSGLTAYEVQVFKVAWGSTGEFVWCDDTVSTLGDANSGPLPVQLLDNGGTPFSSTAIYGSSNKMLDVNIRNQGGSAGSIKISGPGGTGTVPIAGSSSGHWVPIAGSTAGGAIPHVGATTDAGLTATEGNEPTIVNAIGPTGAFAGTISSKLRSISSSLYSIKVGGTGADGVNRASGLSADIRSFASGVTLGIVDTSIAGFTYSNSIQAIAGGVTIGIASVAVDNPVVVGSNSAPTGGTGGGSGWGGTQVRTASTALVSGVRIKNTQGSTTLTVSYDALAGSTTGMTSGWDLDDREEVFIEVDNLDKIYVRSSASATSYSYYAT